MTIGGAVSDLNNLLKADDIPIYYKPSIKKVIETIEQDAIEQRTGHWIYNPYLSTHWSEVYECSECGKGRSKIDCYNGIELDDYCPKCGSKNEVIPSDVS